MKKNLLKFFLVSFIVAMSMSSFSVLALKKGEALRGLPVQDAGRVKPFDSFAREMLEIIHGKTTFKTEGGTSEAYIVVLTWMLTPEVWQAPTMKLFEVRHHEVLSKLNLDLQQRYYSGQELFANEKFNELRLELQDKRQSKEKLTPYFQALQRLENQFFVFQELASGRMLNLLPPKEGSKWIAVADFSEEQQQAFMGVAKAFAQSLGGLANGASSEQMDQLKGDLDQEVYKFMSFAESQNPEVYQKGKLKVETEVNYNTYHPFRFAYSFYLLAVFVLLFMWSTGSTKWTFLSWTLIAIGFLIHNYGFALRVYLTERPPVSNMYETVVWVAWGTVVFAAVLEWFHKTRFVLIAGTLVAVFCLVIADTSPAVLNATLQPLEPVLRSNYWLIVHVMTITISYAAFFLAFGLGDMGLIYYLKGEVKNQDQIKGIAQAIYRAMQIGVVFLAPGIILGGVWADESWGRFWGWDPKETWALIALLGYLAVLHARAGGMLRNFGMIVTAVMSFSLVIMAWYGVNFVLGAGLHSYGFGAGGVEYVSVFLLAHFALVIWAYLKHRKLSV